MFLLNNDIHIGILIGVAITIILAMALNIILNIFKRKNASIDKLLNNNKPFIVRFVDDTYAIKFPDGNYLSADYNDGYDLKAMTHTTPYKSQAACKDIEHIKKLYNTYLDEGTPINTDTGNILKDMI